MTTDISDLIAQRDALERQINSARAAERAAAIARVRTLMAENGLSVADLGTASRPTKAVAKVAPKYSDPSSGTTWSGRGLKPVWLVAALAAGKSLSDFAI